MTRSNELLQGTLDLLILKVLTTGPMHGFRGAVDYWTQCSARQFLPHITVPTLLLQPRNDPFRRLSRRPSSMTSCCLLPDSVSQLPPQPRPRPRGAAPPA